MSEKRAQKFHTDYVWMFLEEFKLPKNCEISMLIKTFCGLFEMIFRLVNVTFSLPEWQALKMTFFTPWVIDISEVTWFRSPISWKKQTHSSRAAGGSSWSHSKPCCHKCCIPILAQTKRLLGIQRDEIFKQCGWLLFPQTEQCHWAGLHWTGARQIPNSF